MKHIFVFFILIYSCFSVQAEYFTIANYDVHIEVSREGFLDVEETIDVHFFEKRHGIIWNIPQKYVYEGGNRELSFTNIYVKGYQFKKSYKNGLFNIRIGSPTKWVNGNQRYILNYRVYNAFINKERHQKLHWNLVGTGWDVPIEKCTYTIVLPDKPELSENDYKVYSYKDQSISKNVIKYNWDGYLTGRANHPLEKNEGLQIELLLPNNYIKSISSLELDSNTSYKDTTNSHEDFSSLISVLTIIFLSGLGLFHFFKSKKQSIKNQPILKRTYPSVSIIKRTNPSVNIKKEVYPPVSITPAEAGFLIDNSADYRDLIAFLPYWGRAGLIKIIKTEDGDYQLVKLKDITTSVEKYELTFFERIFKHSDAPLLIDLKDKFYSDITFSIEQLDNHVVGSNLYSKLSFWFYSFINKASFFLTFFGLILFCIDFGFKYNFIGFCLLTIGIFSFLQKSNLLKKTDKGEDLYYQLLGFKKFIKEASKEEIQEILERDPIYFEKTIPYAIGLRCIYVWADKFDGLEIALPEWYEDKNNPGKVLNFPIAEICSTIEKNFISRPVVKNQSTSKSNWYDSNDSKSSSNSWGSSSSSDSDSSWGWGGSDSYGSGSSSGFGGSGGSSW